MYTNPSGYVALLLLVFLLYVLATSTTTVEASSTTSPDLFAKIDAHGCKFATYQEEQHKLESAQIDPAAAAATNNGKCQPCDDKLFEDGAHGQVVDVKSLLVPHATAVTKSGDKTRVECVSATSHSQVESDSIWCSVTNLEVDNTAMQDTAGQYRLNFRASFASHEDRVVAISRFSSNLIINRLAFIVETAELSKGDNSYTIPGSTVFIRSLHSFPSNAYNTIAMGHLAEEAMKIPELLDRLVEAQILKTDERYTAPHVDNILLFNGYGTRQCSYFCEMLRLSFGKQRTGSKGTVDFKLPRIIYADDPIFRAHNVKFERLLFNDYRKLYFSSERGATLFRSLGVQMCGIKERTEQQEPPKQKRVMFVTRPDARTIQNSDEICQYVASQKQLTPIGYLFGEPAFKVFTVNPGRLSFCDQVAVWHNSDIIYASIGSAMVLQAFARPYSVVTEIYNFGFRLPFSKLIAFYSRLRYLEYFSVDEAFARQFLIPQHLQPIQEGFYACINDWNCIQHLTAVPPVFPLEHFKVWLKEALIIHNHKERDSCEYPVPFPRKNTVLDYTGKNWYTNLFHKNELNFNLCEPEEGCVCCGTHYCNGWLK